MTPQESDELEAILNSFEAITDSGEVTCVWASETARAEAKAALNQLLLKARRDELQKLDTGRHYGKDYQESLDELDENKQNRIAELDKEIET